MSETRVLLGKITALRQRLEQARALAEEAAVAAAPLREDGPAPPARPSLLERQAAIGDEHDTLLDWAVQSVASGLNEENPPRPRLLTARARRVLERGRELLGQLRALADAFPLSPPEETPVPPGPAVPLARLYRETVAIADTALRTIPLFPDSATTQLHLCSGLEATLDVVHARLRTLAAAVERQHQEVERVSRLAALLAGLEAGRAVDSRTLLALAEEVHLDAREGAPLRFLEADPARPPHFAAAHGLTVARVVARVVRQDAELRQHPLEAVLAGLVHDAGMVRVPADVLAHAGPLDDQQRRMVEAHCRDGAALVARLFPEAHWLSEAILGHHERLDGTGYPDGLRETQLRPLPRLLAVCDVYASLCSTRPYRPRQDTRTALTDTLLLAEQGLLDRGHAEALLHLSFYPPGSAVELADGSLGVVVAAPGLRRDLSAPARPVVAVLTDTQGEPLPLPHHLDLAQCDSHSIVRSLSTAERRDLLGSRFPEWV